MRSRDSVAKKKKRSVIKKRGVSNKAKRVTGIEERSKIQNVKDKQMEACREH